MDDCPICYKLIDSNSKTVTLECNQTMDDCPICYKLIDSNSKTVTLECNHTFCNQCILEWFKYKKNCPLCRTSSKLFPMKIPMGVQYEELIFDEDDEDEDEDDDGYGEYESIFMRYIQQNRRVIHPRRIVRERPRINTNFRVPVEVNFVRRPTRNNNGEMSWYDELDRIDKEPISIFNKLNKKINLLQETLDNCPFEAMKIMCRTKLDEFMIELDNL